MVLITLGPDFMLFNGGAMYISFVNNNNNIVLITTVFYFSFPLAKHKFFQLRFCHFRSGTRRHISCIKEGVRNIWQATKTVTPLLLGGR